MFDYLNDIEEMLHGNELKQIRVMKDISGIRMDDHVKTYDQITKDMSSLADEAVEAISAVAYDKKTVKLANKA
jgi:hypothetical protein